MAQTYRKTDGKSTLKLVGGASPGAKPKQFRAGGNEPDGMAPGEFEVLCPGATTTTKGEKTIALIAYRVMVGLHQGTDLLQWIEIKEIDGIVVPGSRYYRQCALALGRQIESGDDLSPAAVFKGRFFRAVVGYRMTLKTGGVSTYENSQRRKDGKDFLRVHKLIAVEESPC